MRAFVMNGIGETGFTEKDRPEPGPTDAILRPTKALVCTSDVHTVHGAIGERENLTLGHEVVGIVDEVGDAVEDFAPGDRVVVGADAHSGPVSRRLGVAPAEFRVGGALVAVARGAGATVAEARRLLEELAA